MPSSPYTDLDRPPLNAARLGRALVLPGGLWTRLDLRAETGSTNADAAAAAGAGDPEGLVVVAERQTAGRGRLGRGWSSPARAGLAVSVLLRPGLARQELPQVSGGRAGLPQTPASAALAQGSGGRAHLRQNPAPAAPAGWAPVPPARYGWLPLLAGVALVESVTRIAEVDAVLKWPNDLLIDGRKCAGILAEAVPAPIPSEPPAATSSTRSEPPGATSTTLGEPSAARTGPAGPPAGPSDWPGVTPSGPPAVVVGIGLNVTLRGHELPDAPDGLPATSLVLAGAAATDRDPLLRGLLRSFGSWYERWRGAGGDPRGSGLYAAYVRHCDTLGRQVRVLLPDGGELAGTAGGLDGDGRLMVRSVTGEERSVAAGDIRHLR